MFPHMGERGLCRCDQVKDLQVQRLSWIIQMAPKRNHMCPYKRETEGDLITDRRGEDNVTMEAEIWSDGATRQGMPVTTRSWKMQEMDSSQEPPGG